MQSDLFGAVDEDCAANQRLTTRNGIPVEPAIAKRYPRTVCYCCETPMVWFVKGLPTPVKLGNEWICGGCLTNHYGITGVLATLQQNGKPIYVETESEEGERRRSVSSDSGTSSQLATD